MQIVIVSSSHIAKLRPAPVAAGFSQICWAEMVFIVNFHPTYHPPTHLDEKILSHDMSLGFG